jgi:hypothetical protein
VQFRAVKRPSAGFAFSRKREPFEFDCIGVGIGFSSELFQVFTNELIHTGTHHFGPVSRFPKHIVIDG